MASFICLVQIARIVGAFLPQHAQGRDNKRKPESWSSLPGNFFSATSDRNKSKNKNNIYKLA